MKRILPFLAAGIFALAACSSDDGETSQSSSSSGGGGTITLSSSSDGTATLSSSSNGAATSSSSSNGETPPGNTVGSCISSEVACYENIAKEDCDEDDDEVFYPGGTCDTSVYSYCYENCEEINSSFTKSDCIDVYEDIYGALVYALFILPEYCLIEPLSGN